METDGDALENDGFVLLSNETLPEEDAASSTSADGGMLDNGSNNSNGRDGTTTKKPGKARKMKHRLETEEEKSTKLKARTQSKTKTKTKLKMKIKIKGKHPGGRPPRTVGDQRKDGSKDKERKKPRTKLKDGKVGTKAMTATTMVTDEVGAFKKEVSPHDHASGMLSMLELCSSGSNGGETEDRDRRQYYGSHADDDGSEMDETSSLVDSDAGSIKTPPKKRAKTSRSDEEGWSDHNRWYCNICKDGGQLLCCDRCPRAFHMSCLGMDEQAVPDSEWYCKMCRECLDRRRLKKETREKARLMRETERLEREAEKRRMKQMKEDILAQKSVEAIEYKAKRVLENKDRIISHKKMKYKDKEEEKLGKLAEDLGETVRLAKERLDKLEKEDAALKKKEEAFNKKRKPADTCYLLQDEDITLRSPPAPLECSFGDMPPQFVGRVLAIWDCLTSFASVLKLSPMTVEQFAAALLQKEHSALVTEVHMCLIDLILEDREDEDYVSDDEGSLDEVERFRYEVQHAPLTVGAPTSNMLNSSSWPGVLYNLIVAVPRYTANCTEALKNALTHLYSSDYPLLDIIDKLELLKFLVYRISMTEAARQMLGKHVAEGGEISKEYNRALLQDRKAAMEEERKLREKHRTELADLTEKPRGGLKTWLKSEKKGTPGNHPHSDSASVEADDERKTVDSVSTASTTSIGSASDSELDDLTEDAISKNEEDLEQQLADEFISRHEYLDHKKQLDAQREKLRRRAEEFQKKQRAQEQLERRRSAAKRGIQEGLVSKDPDLLRAAIEKGVECDLPDRIIVSARHVLEILETEEVREEEAVERKRKYNDAMRQFYIRTEPLGRDRRGLNYRMFRGDPQHLYVHKPCEFCFKDYFQSKSTIESCNGEDTQASSWAVYSSRAELRALIESLDSQHSREHQLKSTLEDNFEQIAEEMPETKPGLMISDLLNEHDAAAARKRTRHAPGTPDDVADFSSWRNEMRQWRKKNHLQHGVDVFKQDLIDVETWLSKRLKELGYESHRTEWMKIIKGITTVEDCIQPLLALEDEVMSFQRTAQKMMGSHSGSNETGKNHTIAEDSGSHADDPNRSDEEDDEDEDEVEDDMSILWPTKKCRDRWITEVNKAHTLSTLSTALACLVQRFEILGLTESAPLDESSVITRRAKTMREKQSRKDRAAKKKQKKEEEAEAASFLERSSADDWEEDCYICGEGGEVLCCDGCTRVFHYSCVGLRRVPRGKTFCHHCDQTVKPVFPVKTRERATLSRTASARSTPAQTPDSEEESDQSDDDDDSSEAEVTVDTASLNASAKHPEDQWDVECNVCHLGGELLCCDGCPHAFHTGCIGLESVPEDEWFCEECDRQTCGKCKKNKIRLDSHVICGSEDGTLGCDRVFHLKCAKLTTVPEEDWFCPKCRKTIQK